MAAPPPVVVVGDNRIGTVQSNYGSWRETGKAFVLRGFLKSDEFGSRGRQPLRFEQQVVEVAIAASAT